MRTILIARAYIVCGTKTLIDSRRNGNRLFGGKVKAGETIRQALRRELAEELGEELSFELGQVVAVTEQHKRKRRTIEIVMLAHPQNDVIDVRAIDRHNPQWVDIAESGMRFGVTLE